MPRPRQEARAKRQEPAEPGELQVVPLDLVFDPDLPARETMDQGSMEELKESLATIGLLNPIVVKRCGAAFKVVAGHRRTLAARYLGWKEIRALVYPADWADDAAAMLHENIIREQLNAAQEAVFFAQLLDKHKLDEDGLCRLVKRSPAYIGDRLGLLRKDPEIFEALRSGKISFAVARALNRFPEEKIRRYHLDQAIRSGTSSRVVEQWFEDWKSYHVPQLEGVNVGAPAGVPAVPEPSPGIECFLCGGSRDPYNLVSVLIHKWELNELHRILAAAELEVQRTAGTVKPEPESVDKPDGGVQ